MKVKEESEKAGLKFNIKQTNKQTKTANGIIQMASSPITSWQIYGEKVENSGRVYFLGLQNH